MRREGFTLIELLVAIAILMVIVLMMANIFQQSTRAWDTGMRQVETGLEARAVINMIQRELAEAIPAPAGAPSPTPFQPSVGTPPAPPGSVLEFYTRAGTFGPGERHYQRIRYSGLLNKEVTRFGVNPSGPPDSATGGASFQILDNVSQFTVTAPPGVWTNELPPWVQVRLRLNPVTGEDAIIEVWSVGRENLSGGHPQLRSWEILGQ